MTRILVTGSRDFHYPAITETALEAARNLLAALDDVTLVHGAARGLDTAAAHAAANLGWEAEAHPAQWSTHGGCHCKESANRCGFAGFRRNTHMINLGADLVLAFPLHAKNDTTGSRGTWHCATQAAQAGLPVIVVWDGYLFPFTDGSRELIARHAQRLGLTTGAQGQLSLN